MIFELDLIQLNLNDVDLIKKQTYILLLRLYQE